MNSIVINVLLILGLLVNLSIQKLDDGFTVCKTKDLHFGSCLNTAIENGIKYIKPGLPQYNLPPLDPFHLPFLTVGAGSGPVNLDQNYKDIIITGLTDVRVNESYVDFETKTLRFSTLHPLMEQKAQYNINGKVLMLPVHGTGYCTLTLENLFSNHVIQFEEVVNQGELYYMPKSYSLKLNPNHARYLFENLFDGNKLLGDNINNLINQEWHAIFQDVEEGYEKGYSDFYLQYAKGIFEKIPEHDIFIQ